MYPTIRSCDFTIIYNEDRVRSQNDVMCFANWMNGKIAYKQLQNIALLLIPRKKCI